jgi:glyceraldehyde 3-phosphate dehydrogenase
MINVAINGFGRIGRMVFRAAQSHKKINIIAINDLTDTHTLAYLLKYDSVQGEFPKKVAAINKHIMVGNKRLQVFAEKDPSNLPWKKLKIDVVVESTGFFRRPEDAARHLKAGAKKVLLSAAPKCEHKCPPNVAILVLGVNNQVLKKRHTIVSNASCTTNCVAPILKVLNDHVGVKRCYFTTIHSYTSSQKLQDGPHKNLRRSRAAAVNVIPTSTNADKATIEAIPALKEKVRGLAFRVPTVNGSVTDFTIETEKPVNAEDINKLFKKQANGTMKGIIQYMEDEVVSSDIVGNPHSSILDASLTQVVDRKILKIVSWYDNEWGYSNRMVDLIKLIS